MPERTDLPQLVLIADGFTRSGQDQRIVQAVKYGIRWVVLRDHGARPDVVELSAGLLIRRMRSLTPAIRIGLNGPEDVARRLGIGWHRTSHAEHAPPIGSGPAAAPEGRSTHSRRDILQAIQEDLDYVLFGHVFDTASHRGESPRGIAALAAACDAASGSMPVIAIGGITPDKVRECLDAGAAGVAVLSGLMQAPNLFQAVEAYMKALTPPFRAE